MIPFLDLQAVNAPHLNTILEAAQNEISSGTYILNETLEKFEAQFATYCGVRYCIGVANGSQAIELILRAWDFPQGSEIIIPANTYIATVLPVINLGLKPVFIEPDPLTYLIDYQKIESAITSKTRAILAVHLYGKCCNMDEVHSIANKNNLKVLTDAAQAHGSIFKEKRAGNLTEAEAFSFYPTKNLGAMGDGGAITTNNQNLWDKIRMLRNYGFSEKNKSILPGINSRLDALQAAILSIKLKSLDTTNQIRKRLASKYLNNIKTPHLLLPCAYGIWEDNWHLFVVRHPERDRLRKYLLGQGIETAIHYPIPPHRQPIMASQNLSFPIAQKLSEEILSLPLNPALSMAQADFIIDTLNKFK